MEAVFSRGSPCPGFLESLRLSANNSLLIWFLYKTLNLLLFRRQAVECSAKAILPAPAKLVMPPARVVEEGVVAVEGSGSGGSGSGGSGSGGSGSGGSGSGGKWQWREWQWREW